MAAMTQTSPEPLWTPDVQDLRHSKIAEFHRWVTERYDVPPGGYHELWAWSVAQPGDFWEAVWDFAGFGERGPGPVMDDVPMPGTGWFAGTRVNLAAAVLAPGEDDEPAVISRLESGSGQDSGAVLTRGELRAQVASVAQGLRDLGIGMGDRVVGYLPNVPEAIVAFLAAASIGATWSSVGQDYSARAVVDRFGQLDPVLLFAGDGYHWNGKTVDRSADIQQVRRELPTLRHTVFLPHLSDPQTTAEQAQAALAAADAAADEPPGDQLICWSTLLATDGAGHEPQQVPFEHPLWVLYSSGTTGLPKGLVHSHGGILVEGFKMLGLLVGLGPQDRLFWYTSPSWMMWNFQLMALIVGASVVTYDGSPLYPDAGAMWRLVADEHVTAFGLSPGLLMATETAGIRPGTDLDLRALRWLGSTGSPLSPHSHRWAFREVGPIPLASISGGTDVCTAFAGGAPNLPIWPGELSAPALGVALDSWDGAGNSLRGQVGEMVITQPMPSMPLYLWNDPDGRRYRDAYFTTYGDVHPHVWRHGDWITITDRGSVIIQGRSDSTLNKGGVRMGSADIYAALERLPEVVEALVIGAEQEDGSYWMPLFVVLAEGVTLDDELVGRMKAMIREHASPRHVPDEIQVVRGIPHTKTGKKLEVPIKRLLLGAAREAIVNPESVDDPSLLDDFEAIGRAHRGAD